MAQEPQKFVPDYAQPLEKSKSLPRRVLLCVGLPMIAFGLGFGITRTGDSVVVGGLMAVGSFLVALMLPIRE